MQKLYVNQRNKKSEYGLWKEHVVTIGYVATIISRDIERSSIKSECKESTRDM